MDLFKKIKQDNTSGSGAILNSVQEEILQFLASNEKISMTELKNSLKELQAKFPRFGVLIHFIESLEKWLNKDGIENRKKIDVYIRDYIEKWKNAQDRASERLITEVDLDKKQVLLHSHSSAIINLFDHLTQQKIKPLTWQTFSSPIGEGVIQAETLNKMGFDARLIHEDAIGNFISQIDLAVFGADLVLKNDFLNKAGTYPLSVFLNRHHKPVYVLAEPRKVFNATQQERPELYFEKKKPSGELYQGKSALQVFNYYFDFTPLLLVKNLILELVVMR